jgi:hypothetical protein
MGAENACCGRPAPAVPGGGIRSRLASRPAGASHHRNCHWFGGAQIARHGAALIGRKSGALGFHVAGLERFHDFLPRHIRQLLRHGSMGFAVRVVAANAISGWKLRSALLRVREQGEDKNEEHGTGHFQFERFELNASRAISPGSADAQWFAAVCATRGPVLPGPRRPKAAAGVLGAQGSAGDLAALQRYRAIMQCAGCPAQAILWARGSPTRNKLNEAVSRRIEAWPAALPLFPPYFRPGVNRPSTRKSRGRCLSTRSATRGVVTLPRIENFPECSRRSRAFNLHAVCLRIHGRQKNRRTMSGSTGCGVRSKRFQSEYSYKWRVQGEKPISRRLKWILNSQDAG